MSNLNTVPEGAPLTYELINQIINAINQLQGDENSGLNQIIDVYAPRIGRGDNSQVLICAGEFTLKFSSSNAGQVKGTTARTQVTFPNSKTFRELPYIAIAINDPSPPTEGKMSYVVATVYDLKKNGFGVRGRRLLPANKGGAEDELTGTYIAIGQGTTTI